MPIDVGGQFWQCWTRQQNRRCHLVVFLCRKLVGDIVIICTSNRFARPQMPRKQGKETKDKERHGTRKRERRKDQKKHHRKKDKKKERENRRKKEWKEERMRKKIRRLRYILYTT